MKRAELQVGGAYFHKSSQYGSGKVVIVLSDQPYVEDGYSRIREGSRFRPANPHQKRRSWGQDNRSGVLVAMAYLPYGGYTNAKQPFDPDLYWSCTIVQLRDIQSELVPAGGDFVAVMTARAQAALDAHRKRIEADHLRTQQHEAMTERCKAAIEGAGLESGYTPDEGRAVVEVKYGKGRVTLSIEDFERLAGHLITAKSA